MKNLNGVPKDKVYSIAIFLLIIGFITFLMHPGAMTWDSIDQLNQARVNKFRDWQPPIMAIYWSGLLQLAELDLMLASSILSLCLSLIMLYLWGNKNKYSIIFLLIPFSPWVINYAFVVWKDVQLAYSWLLVIAIALFYGKKINPIICIFGFIIFTYGFLIRHNSFFGGIVLLSFYIYSTIKFNFKKSILISAIYCIICSFSMPYILGTFFDVKKNYPFTYVMFDDIAGLRKSGISISPPNLSIKELSKLDHCPNIIGTSFCIDAYVFDNINANLYDQYKNIWISGIIESPLKYIEYRLSAFRELIRSPKMSTVWPYEFKIPLPPYFNGSGYEDNRGIQSLLTLYLNSSLKIIRELFKPYFWVICNLLITFAMSFNKVCRTEKLWLIPISGGVYFSSFIFTAPTGDFRFAYYLVLVTTISFLIYIISIKKNTQ